MVKDLLIGLSVGVIAGAFMVKNVKPCSDAVDAITKAADKKMKEMDKKKKPSTASKTQAKEGA